MILELQNILHSKYELSLYFIPFTLCPCKVNKQTNTKQPHTQLVPQPENWEWKDLTSFKAHKSMAKHTHTHKIKTTTKKQKIRKEKECLKKKKAHKGDTG